MDDDGQTRDALIDLKASIDGQNKLQEEANGIMRGVVEALKNLAQEIADWREEMPEARRYRQRKTTAAKKAAVGKYATPPPPRRKS